MKQIHHPVVTGECFFCGSLNPVGLKLAFFATESEPTEVVCRWKPPSTYTGFGRILHGGIQSGLFDEIMGWTAAHVTERVGVTAGLRIKFLRPLYVEQEIEVRCRVKSKDGAKIHLEAEIKDASGTICTSATGTYRLMELARFKQLVESGLH